MPDTLTDIVKNVGDNIRRLRLDKELSQQHLAESAGVSANYLAQIERGEVNFSLGILAKIAESLKCPAQDIISGEETVMIDSALAEFCDGESIPLAIALKLAKLPNDEKRPTTVAGWKALHQKVKAYV
jgi:transcriptional regulator with XRE-family HTH domain